MLRVSLVLLSSFLTLSAVGGGTALADELEDRLGRSEVRVLSAPTPVVPGRTVAGLALPERLTALGMTRVRGRRPERPGEFFWGHEHFRIWLPPHPIQGRDRDERWVLRLRKADGLVLAVLDGDEQPTTRSLLLPREVLAESLDGRRAPRRPLPFEEMPEIAWRALLAAEDARFFDHHGLDAKGIARALLANVRAGKTRQGGSTLTQQLVKMRDLTPKRTLGRKMSEAVRSLALEAEHDKEEILASYLNHVYYGHVDGVAIHGLGAAARAFFSKDARELQVHEAALLAGIIQAPNRLAPHRHPKRAKKRRDWVLSRLDELGWVPVREMAAARKRGLGLKLSPPDPPPAREVLGWARELARQEASEHLDKGRGVIVRTTIDPQLQRWAEEAVADHLARLRRDYRSLRKAPVQAVLTCLDARTGQVLAHVGGDPSQSDELDRARRAQRQPGSTVKPLVLLEALERCGARPPLHLARRIADEPLRVDLPSGPWEPSNSDDLFRGEVSVREALRDSLNVPFVRLCTHCGLDPTAERLRSLGLSLPQPPPPAFVLGAVEATPLEMAQAYTVLENGGEWRAAHLVTRLERSGGRRISKTIGAGSRRPVDASTAYLVRDVLRQTVLEGTASVVALEGHDLAAKTGTSSDRRDAWLVGGGDGLVTAVWVGRDDGGRLGLTGASGAGPLWREFMKRALPARPPAPASRPAGIVVQRIDPRTGLAVKRTKRGGVDEIFRSDAQPPRKRFWRRNDPEAVLR
ncbi:MAG: transglycosylase domain-containing protein [Acidobacteriota bacterium]